MNKEKGPFNYQSISDDEEQQKFSDQNQKQQKIQTIKNFKSNQKQKKPYMFKNFQSIQSILNETEGSTKQQLFQKIQTGAQNDNEESFLSIQKLKDIIKKHQQHNQYQLNPDPTNENKMQIGQLNAQLNVQCLPSIVFTWEELDSRLMFGKSGYEVVCVSSVGKFKSCVGNIKLQPGTVSYWEIQIQSGCHFKIGVTQKSKKHFAEEFKNITEEKAQIFQNKIMSHVNAYSDVSLGYSYYSFGELRHNSDKKGTKYSNGYGQKDVIGVLFNQCQGTLSYFKNGLCLGVAFTVSDFTTLPFYPFAACLMKGEAFFLKIPERED